MNKPSSRNRQKAVNLLRELAIAPDEGRVKLLVDVFRIWDQHTYWMLTNFNTPEGLAAMKELHE